MNRYVDSMGTLINSAVCAEVLTVVTTPLKSVLTSLWTFGLKHIPDV